MDIKWLSFSSLHSLFTPSPHITLHYKNIHKYLISFLIMYQKNCYVQLSGIKKDLLVITGRRGMLSLYEYIHSLVDEPNFRIICQNFLFVLFCLVSSMKRERQCLNMKTYPGCTKKINSHFMWYICILLIVAKNELNEEKRIFRIFIFYV